MVINQVTGGRGLRSIWVAAVVLIFGASALPAGGAEQRKLSAVPFNDVKVQDQFWTPRIETNREKSLPHNLKWCEQTGRISNFAKAGGLVPGKFEGIYFNDSDVYKVLEGASYSLADKPDPALEKAVDDVIAKIAAAQQKDGYLNSFYTLAEPGKRWTNLKDKHELYCGGHMIEAAVAHYRATGKKTFLDVATKFADHVDQTFGPKLRHGVCGHEEIELSLVKLYQATGEKRYLDLANFFIDIRGDKSQREIWGPYCQDHVPVRKQDEIVGHAVRAMYLYSGTADVAAYSRDQELVGAMDRLWRNVVQQKMYITGGIGAKHGTEAFGEPYELPNGEAYCETCAAIGLALWAHRLNLMHADAQYADVLEQTLYNGILSGVALDGKSFFYVNPLASDGKHHRQPFFDCACCPSNVVRFIPSVPGYVYAVGDDHFAHTSGPADGVPRPAIYVNLYVAGTAKVKVGDKTVTLKQETLYPWDGKVKLTIDPDSNKTDQRNDFSIYLRVPAWCPNASVSVRGTALPKPKIERGYVRLAGPWRAGDVIELDLPMDIQRIEAHPLVKADAGRVAVQRGPVVYCFEGVDNGGQVKDLVLPRDPKFTAEYRKDLLGGVTVIKGVDVKGKEIMAVPYHIWDHRQPGEMAVWVMQDDKPAAEKADVPAWKDKLYRPLDLTGESAAGR